MYRFFKILCDHTQITQGKIPSTLFDKQFGEWWYYCHFGKNYIIFGLRNRNSSICKEFAFYKLWDGKIAIHGLKLPECASCTLHHSFMEGKH